MISYWWREHIRLSPWLWICALALALVLSALVCRCSSYSPPCPPDGVEACQCSSGEHGRAYCLIDGWSSCYCVADGGAE